MNDVSKLHDKTSTTILTAALVLVAMLYLFPTSLVYTQLFLNLGQNYFPIH